MICTQLHWRKPILRDRRGQFFPMFSESPALPTKDDLRLHENEALSSVGPDFSEQAQQNAVASFYPRPLDAPLVHTQLRPQCQTLRLKGCAEPKYHSTQISTQFHFGFWILDFGFVAPCDGRQSDAATCYNIFIRTTLYKHTPMFAIQNPKSKIQNGSRFDFVSPFALSGT